MANPYTSVTVTGYNASPPPDDGSQIASNKVTWSGQKTKLTDPLNTAIAQIDANVLAAFASSLQLSSPSTSFRNTLMNASFEVWQRGAGGAASITSASAATTLVADRWVIRSNADNLTISQVAGIADGSRWACKVQRDLGQAGAGNARFEQAYTLDQLTPLLNKKVTVSFTLKGGANFTTTLVQAQLFAGTGGAAKRLQTAYTGETTVVTVNAAPTTAATRFSNSSIVVVPATTTQLALQFLIVQYVGTAGADDSVTIDDVQVEVGDNTQGPTTFERKGFQQDLAECEFHYCKTLPYGTAPATGAGVTGGLNVFSGTGVTNTEGLTWQFPRRMFKTPTITTYNPTSANANWRDVTSGADRAVTVGTVSDTSVPISLAAGVAATTNVIHADASAEV